MKMNNMKTMGAVVAIGLAFVAQADPDAVRVAASNSTEIARRAADYVCTGVGDELTIQRAIEDCARTGRQLSLSSGFYTFSAVHAFKDGGPDTAVCIPNMHRDFAITGERRKLGGWAKGMGTNAVNGVVFYLAPEALAAVKGASVDIVRGEWSQYGIMNGSGLTMENVCIWAPDSQHALRALDLRRVNSVELHNVRLFALGKASLSGLKYPYGNPPVPNEDCIGITLTDGSNNAPVNLVNVSAGGFGQSFQVGGEHVVMINCSATFGLYGFTFGNYRYDCAFNHPITLINCCDEQNVNLPLFNSCGDNGGNLHGRQSVTMISFNTERVASHVPGKKLGSLMRETKPGTWCGQISFTTQPDWGAVNAVNLPLWEEDGSGRGFRTVNDTHKLACTTAERLSYYPQYMQQVFDTDLNKLLICVDPAKRKWVDANGVEVR